MHMHKLSLLPPPLSLSHTQCKKTPHANTFAHYSFYAQHLPPPLSLLLQAFTPISLKKKNPLINKHTNKTQISHFSCQTSC